MGHPLYCYTMWHSHQLIFQMLLRSLTIFLVVGSPLQDTTDSASDSALFEPWIGYQRSDVPREASNIIDHLTHSDKTSFNSVLLKHSFVDTPTASFCPVIKANVQNLFVTSVTSLSFDSQILFLVLVSFMEKRFQNIGHCLLSGFREYYSCFVS